MMDLERALYRILDVVTEDEESLWSIEGLMRQYGFSDPRETAIRTLAELAAGGDIEFARKRQDGTREALSPGDALIRMSDSAEWALREDAIVACGTTKGYEHYAKMPFRED